MVKRWKAVWMLTVAVAMVGCATVQGADPNGLHFSFWPTAGDSVAEVRLGAQWGLLELYGAPRYDKTLPETSGLVTDVRAYGIYNAVSAEVIANMLGDEVELPDGAAYAGIYGGCAFHEEKLEAGWLAGARIDVTGPRFLLK